MQRRNFLKRFTAGLGTLPFIPGMAQDLSNHLHRLSVDVDVKALGVDTYAYSGHKWLLAPKGSGLLYIRREVQDRIHPTFLHSGYRSYTASGGTRGVDRILGNGVTIDFHNAIRFSTHIFNDESEIDRTVDILRKVLAEG